MRTIILIILFLLFFTYLIESTSLESEKKAPKRQWWQSKNPPKNHPDQHRYGYNPNDKREWVHKLRNILDIKKNYERLKNIGRKIRDFYKTGEIPKSPIYVKTSFATQSPFLKLPENQPSELFGRTSWIQKTENIIDDKEIMILQNTLRRRKNKKLFSRRPLIFQLSTLIHKFGRKNKLIHLQNVLSEKKIQNYKMENKEENLNSELFKT